jgi:phosphoribosylamine--glycine ligase
MRSPSRVLVVGSGAREHALAWRLAADPGVVELHVAPGSAGMRRIATVHPTVAVVDTPGLVGLAEAIGAELVVVGPEAPLAAGLADALVDAGVAAFGPSRAASALESSKAFCREIAAAAGIPMAPGEAFHDAGDALAFARRLGAPLAVKADGLAGGKGVALCPTLGEAERAIRAALEDGAFGEAGRRVVVERLLEGREASLMAVCDGATALALPAARDHKRVADGDRGPNTGGMGAYSPVPGLDGAEAERLLDVFHRPALAEMARRGTPFRGVLYAGLMLTDAEGPVLLEFNVRFGDPEAQAVLPRLGRALAPLLLAAARGGLAGRSAAAVDAGAAALAVRDEAAVAVVLAAEGYPGRPATGVSIEGIADAHAAGALVFHGATAERDGGYVTAGGRVLTVVGQGPDLEAARAAAYGAAARIRFAGMHHRRDIAADPVAVAGAARAAEPQPAGARA